MSHSCPLADRERLPKADQPIDPRISTVRHYDATAEHLTASQHGFATELVGAMDTRGANRPPRSFAALLAVWLGFFSLQTAVSRALWPSALPLGLVAQIVGIQASLWALLSVGVAAWHKRARATASNVWILLALHVPTLAAVALIDSAVSRLLSRVLLGVAPTVSFLFTVVYYADFEIVSYLAIVAVAEALLVRRVLLERQRLSKRLEASLGRARLDYLEAQLQPHFLFNSLGAVSELAYDAPATASRVLRQLIAIFRTALARKSDEVTLGEEIVGIEPYLDIQRIRFADWLTIDYLVDDAAVDCLLPRFILQPLVENAIRHGLSGRSAAGRIQISAMVDQGSLIVRVTDNGVGFDAMRASTGRGIGLANVRDRLAILYGDDDRLSLTSSDSGGAVAELTIPVRRRNQNPELRSFEAPEQALVTNRDTDLRVLRVPSLFRRPAIAIGTIWFMCGLLWTQQSAMFQILRHRATDSWLVIARHDMTSAAIWALLTPAVLALANRYPLRRRGVVRAIAYVVAGGITTFVHAAAWQRIASPEVPLLSRAWQMTFIVDFAIYCVLVAVGHRRVLSSWLRSREAAAEALSVELAAAQTRAVKLQAIPPVLLQSLDGIAASVRHDPKLTERQLTRLGDYLRLALECTDERGITPERERALESAVAALRDSGAYSLNLTLSA
jgi:sensor histidine kinase YesM